MVPLSSLFQLKQLCSSNHAVHLCCACRIGLAHPQHTGFSMDGLHGTCTDCCIAGISFTEIWEPCVHMPGLHAMTVQHDLASLLEPCVHCNDPVPHKVGLLHTEVRERSDSFLQFQAMSVGSPNTERSRRYEPLAFFFLELFLSRIVARLGYTCVSKFL